MKTAGKVVATRIFSFAPAKDSKLPKLNWGWARFKFIRLWGQLAPKLKLGKKSGGSQTRTSLAQRSFFGKWADLDPCSQISKSRWLLVKVRCYQCMHVIHVTSWKTAAEQVDKHILFRVVPLCLHVLILKIERHRQMCGMHPLPPKNETNWCKSTRIFWNGSGLAMFWPTWIAINISVFIQSDYLLLYPPKSSWKADVMPIAKERLPKYRPQP